MRVSSPLGWNSLSPGNRKNLPRPELTVGRVPSDEYGTQAGRWVQSLAAGQSVVLVAGWSSKRRDVSGSIAKTTRPG
jgi:uncharacterized protein (DUF2237 family)